MPTTLYPFTFRPIFKERIWGGRNLKRLYQKAIPPNLPIGESWEISDRPGDESVIANGSLAGKTLRWLMVNHGDDLLGTASPATSGRFPLLIKILDAQEKLSLQVHPPAIKAIELGGEPKTEMWYVAHATAEADLFVGLKSGTTRDEFERRVRRGTVAECFHRINVRNGDAMFLPSGRVHALGAGNVIFEIQQNSDTTYRVFDWNRVDSDGKPRDLHIKQSLQSIDFNDIEPALISAKWMEKQGCEIRSLINDALFSVDLVKFQSQDRYELPQRNLQIIGVTEGEINVLHAETSLTLSAGQFALISASMADVRLAVPTAASLIHIMAK